MRTDEVDSLRARLRHCLMAAKGLPSADIASIEVLITAGEWEIALDTLCTQLYEYDISPSTKSRDELLALGRKLNVEVAYLLGDPQGMADKSD
jgi:hypothetical protein